MFGICGFKSIFRFFRCFNGAAQRISDQMQQNYFSRFTKYAHLLIFVQVIILLFSIDPVYGQQQSKCHELEWCNNLENAKVEAAKTGKCVMLYFSGSDWCKPCIQLTKNVIETQPFRDFADSVVIPLRVDFPRLKKHRLATEQQKYNEHLAQQYNPNGVFPYLVFIDEKGMVKATSSYSAASPSQFIEHLQELLNQ